MLDREQKPMLAKLVRELPDGDVVYEPKWDAFRCLAFREHDDVDLRSRHGRALGRYFPELRARSPRCRRSGSCSTAWCSCSSTAASTSPRSWRGCIPPSRGCASSRAARDGRYEGGARAMLKVKHERSADCVVARVRPTPEGDVAALLLGLYDAGARLEHIGVASSFGRAARAQMAVDLAPLTVPLEGHPGHPARFARWRPDREPRSCLLEQLEPLAAPAQVLGA